LKPTNLQPITHKEFPYFNAGFKGRFSEVSLEKFPRFSAATVERLREFTEA
jgi:hypothetical protein